MKLNLFSTVALAFLVLTSCEGDKEDDDLNDSASLPVEATGSYDMEVTFADTNAPFTLGQVGEFTFTTGGMMSVDIDPAANNGTEVSLGNATQNGSEYTWSDAANSTEYVLSLTAEDSINEVNVFVSGAFVNQWSPAITGQQNISLIQNMFGQYTVTSVSNGTHSRGTVDISLNGDIDFDTGISYSTSEFNLITNRIDVLGEVFIDIAPYPTEPHPRFVITVDANTPTIATGMTYYPSYPSITGRVEVVF